MAKQKIDGVVEAVHYAPDGRVDWVRAYLRHGVTFTDHILIPRHELLTKLREGKRFLVGMRKPYLGGMFETTQPLNIVAKNGHEVLVVGEAHAEQDNLEGVPII